MEAEKWEKGVENVFKGSKKEFPKDIDFRKV